MSNDLIGRFYFKPTSNGNLVGEFSNNFSNEIQAKSAVSIKKISNFFGTYRSTWYETNSATPVTLEITP